MVTMTGVRLASRTAERAQYRVTLEVENGAADYYFSVALVPVDGQVMMVGQTPREAEDDFYDLAYKALPGEREGGALSIPLLKRVVRAVMRIEQGWPLRLPIVVEGPVAAVQPQVSLEVSSRLQRVAVLFVDRVEDGAHHLVRRVVGSEFREDERHPGALSARVKGIPVRATLEYGKDHLRLWFHFMGGEESLSYSRQLALGFRDICERLGPVAAMLLPVNHQADEAWLNEQDHRLVIHDVQSLLQLDLDMLYVNGELADKIARTCDLSSREELGVYQGRLFFANVNSSRWT